jgi:hypothetical protein
MQFKEIAGVGVTTEVVLITVLGAILAGQTLSVEVDGVLVSVPFNTNTNTTISNLATAIAAEPLVTTAVAATNTITVTAASSGTAMTIIDGQVEGNNVEAIVYAEVTTVASSADATGEIEVIAYARAGLKTSDREWQVRKLLYRSGPQVTANLFAVYPPVQLPRSDYLFSFDGVKQVQEIFFSRGPTLLDGNTVNLDVDGSTLNQVFDTDHNTTLDALATQIQGESGVVTAVRRGDSIIEVTAVGNGLPVLLNKQSVTGGNLTTRIEIRETKHGQPSAKFMNFA